MTDAESIARHLDEYLGSDQADDYPGAVNGLQLTNTAPVTKIAAAVDVSLRTIQQCIKVNANFLIVHHGMFWGAAAPFTGSGYRRLKLLLQHDVAVYSSHLPLDRHPVVGNNVLLARELGLDPTSGFANFGNVPIGVAGDSDLPTSEILDRARGFARKLGGDATCSFTEIERRTRRWGLCTGAGASAETLQEARSRQIDTLIVGEGPHWTSVAAEDDGITIIFAGHYATETLGVRALAGVASESFKLPFEFLYAPTGQ